MITYVNGSIFVSPARVLVNTVNTEGVMGKGIALRFKKIFPEMFREYQHLCESRVIDIGVLWLFKTSHKWILNFPTKRSWRQPSRLDYIEAGLAKFRKEYAELKIHSIAFPALGCGNGELNWDDVRPVMEEYLSDLPLNVFVHPPHTQVELPEHRNQAEIATWLRAEPSTLPFTEVWRDIEMLLSEKRVFSTGAKAFTAYVEDNLQDRMLVAVTESRKHTIAYDSLKEIWSRFRTVGYLRRGFVTADVEKKLYYLMPILAELPYVDPITLSEKGTHRSYNALQYVAATESNRQQTLFPIG